MFELRLLLAAASHRVPDEVLRLQLGLVPVEHPLERVIDAVAARVVHRELRALHGDGALRGDLGGQRERRVEARLLRVEGPRDEAWK